MTHIRTSKLKWLCSVLLTSSLSVALSQTEEQLSFLFVGDVMQHGPQINGAYNQKMDRYEYDRSFQFVKPLIESVDIAIANLEVTHAGKPYKGYPQFSAPDELSQTLKNTGFDVLLTSNNHSCDGGGRGVIRTLDVLDELGIRHTGTFRNKAERNANYPLIIEQKGMRVAILNYTYGTNGLTVPSPIVINYIDSAVIKADVAKAREQADYIICTMHWGTEYQHLPNAYQKNYEAYCYDLGVDMVIGGHPHVVQPVERKVVHGEEKLTAWSLGNFVSNQRDRYKNGGLIVTASIARQQNTDGKGERIVLRDANYWSEYVHTRMEGIYKTYYILPEYPYEQLDSNFMDAAAVNAMQEFYADTRALITKHGKGVSEKKLGQSPEIDRVFKGYYAVLLHTRNASSEAVFKARHPELVYMYPSMNGTEYTLSGMAATQQEAEVNRDVLRKLGESGDLKIVRVTRDQIQIL